MKLLSVPGRKQTEIERKLKPEVTLTLSRTGRKTINHHSTIFLKKQHQMDRIEEAAESSFLGSKDTQDRRAMMHDILAEDAWTSNPDATRPHQKRNIGIKTQI